MKGTCSAIERARSSPINVLTNIYGVGAKKAMALIENGITTIDDVRKRGMDQLNDKQKLGVKYYDDILKRIPRSEIDGYKGNFKSAMDTVNTAYPDTMFEIVGSYRRGNMHSGDIDVIVTNHL